MNLMVQLVLKQGQVEVMSDDFISEYNTSILLHKAVVEDLNNTIQVRKGAASPQTQCSSCSAGRSRLKLNHGMLAV